LAVFHVHYFHPVNFAVLKSDRKFELDVTDHLLLSLLIGQCELIQNCNAVEIATFVDSITVVQFELFPADESGLKFR